MQSVLGILSQTACRKEFPLNWNLEEAITHYKKLGAPQDQNALIQLLTEIQQFHGGSIPSCTLPPIAREYGIKDSYLLAIIKRIPRLRLSNTHVLEICSGSNCGRHTQLAAFSETLASPSVTVKSMPCMRMCGKGPNIKWDNKVYHRATPELLQQLIKQDSLKKKN